MCSLGSSFAEVTTQEWKTFSLFLPTFAITNKRVCILCEEEKKFSKNSSRFFLRLQDQQEQMREPNQLFSSSPEKKMRGDQPVIRRIPFSLTILISFFQCCTSGRALCDVCIDLREFERVRVSERFWSRREEEEEESECLSILTFFILWSFTLHSCSIHFLLSSSSFVPQRTGASAQYLTD